MAEHKRSASENKNIIAYQSDSKPKASANPIFKTNHQGAYDMHPKIFTLVKARGTPPNTNKWKKLPH